MCGSLGTTQTILHKQATVCLPARGYIVETLKSGIAHGTVVAMCV